MSDNADLANEILIEFFEKTESGYVKTKCDEVLKEYRKTFPLFLVGYVILFLMVGLDILTNRNDILSMVISNPDILNAVFSKGRILEDMFKVLAEGMFIVAFLACFRIARQRVEG